jgi:hypothetical protein
MTLENETLRYEVLPTEPPEKRPTTTQAFLDFKVLVLTTALVKTALYIRRRHMRLDTAKLERNLKDGTNGR